MRYQNWQIPLLPFEQPMPTVQVIIVNEEKGRKVGTHFSLTVGFTPVYAISERLITLGLRLSVHDTHQTMNTGEQIVSDAFDLWYEIKREYL